MSELEPRLGRITRPNGARCAVASTFDFDAEEAWIGEGPANADKPSVLSQRTYGAKVAVPLASNLFERQGIRATFLIPGRVGERHADRAMEIVCRGRELAHHGYTHTSPTDLP
jgi:peptidoglycan/xylan/chitin deacetylase (PgdA/CDA1 family)